VAQPKLTGTRVRRHAGTNRLPLRGVLSVDLMNEFADRLPGAFV